MAGWKLAMRFGLEMAALVGIVVGGRELVDGLTGQLVGIAIAILAATAWGLFNVPGDPSRSGNAPVEVSGIVRLCVEFDVFALGGAGLLLAAPSLGALFIGLVLLHYATTPARLRWLLAQSG